MTQKYDSERIQECREFLKIKLAELSNDKSQDILLDYEDVSHAFPGGLHPSFHGDDIRLIDWNEFTVWANTLGWSVCSAPEVTSLEDRDTPWVRCSRHQGGPCASH